MMTDEQIVALQQDLEKLVDQTNDRAVAAILEDAIEGLDEYMAERRMSV